MKEHELNKNQSAPVTVVFRYLDGERREVAIDATDPKQTLYASLGMEIPVDHYTSEGLGLKKIVSQSIADLFHIY